MAFVCLAQIMHDAGATSYLAEVLTDALGRAYVFVSPVVGALVGLMTGSNTSSNAMFIQFQTEVARRLGVDPSMLAIVQNVAASNATMASPSRIVLATTVTDMRGQEGSVMKFMLPTVVGTTAIIVLFFISRALAP